MAAARSANLDTKGGFSALLVGLFIDGSMARHGRQRLAAVSVPFWLGCSLMELLCFQSKVPTLFQCPFGWAVH